MRGHECYHCKQWVAEGEAHDCWTTTEQALTKDLSEDLREAWERLREAAAELGEQRIYASHHSIMFARKTCYAFVRPKRSFLELVIFLGRTVRSPKVRRADASSKSKVYHVVPIRHRDEVEAPITDWLAEAYHRLDAAGPAKASAGKTPAKAAKAVSRSAAPSTDRSPTPAAPEARRRPMRRRSAPPRRR
jgi:hypothetical protein